MAKSLVLYFSVYGTAKAVAEEIARQTGADLMAIEPAVPYDSDRNHYNALAKLAKKEHDEDRRPAIRNAIPVGEYDTFYTGYPMWWYTFPMILYTLFDQYDFSGKTIIPFNTHMGSGDGRRHLPHDPQAGPASGNDGGGERRDGAGKEVAEGRRETFSRRNAHRRRIKTV